MRDMSRTENRREDEEEKKTRKRKRQRVNQRSWRWHAVVQLCSYTYVMHSSIYAAYTRHVAASI